jgi:hypothetical protein
VKVEKLAKNWQKGQNSQPLSPGVCNYAATVGGLPKAVRGNATHMALWRTNDMLIVAINEKCEILCTPPLFCILFLFIRKSLKSGGSTRPTFWVLSPPIYLSLSLADTHFDTIRGSGVGSFAPSVVHGSL